MFVQFRIKVGYCKGPNGTTQNKSSTYNFIVRAWKNNIFAHI